MIEPAEAQPATAHRGMRSCHRCHRRALRLVDTRRPDNESARGAVGAIRTFECTSPGCETRVRFVEISCGETAQRSLRMIGTEGIVRVEVFPAIIVVKA